MSKYTKNYVDIFTDIVNRNGHINSKYLNYNFKNETNYSEYKNYDYDPIHVSNSLSELFLQKIKTNNVIGFTSAQLVRDSKYKCYII
jgi:hypothetical protein